MRNISTRLLVVQEAETYSQQFTCFWSWGGRSFIKNSHSAVPGCQSFILTAQRRVVSISRSPWRSICLINYSGAECTGHSPLDVTPRPM